jgi:hypothetical protein
MTHTGAGTITPTLKSPKYVSNMDCEWTIQAPEGSVILFYIDQLDLEDKYDTLLIFDVSNEEQFLTGSHRSVKSTKEYLNHLRSYGREAVVTFHSDESTERSGFSLKYEFIAASACGVPMLMTEETTFSDSFFGKSPVLIPPYLDCYWSVQAPANTAVLLDFSKMDILCDVDMHITLYDDLTQAQVDRSDVCGKNKAFLSYTGQFGLKFVTGETGGGSGFIAETIFFPSCPGSGTTLTEAGTITPSLDSPAYGNNMRCQWTIEAPEGSVILFHIEQLDLEDKHDTLLIFDVSKKMQLLSGSNRSVKPSDEFRRHIRSYGRNAKVTFHSDKERVGSGFSLKYEFIAASACGVPMLITEESTFSDGFFGDNVVIPPHLDCYWSVQAPAGKVAVLDFSKHDIPCNVDADITLYDDLTQAHAEHSNVCGKNKSFFAYSGQYGLKFVTGETGGGTGFVAKASFLPSCPGSGTTLTEAGTITPSLDSPAYGNNMRCQWKIKAPEGSVILFYVEQLDLEDKHDTLLIFDVSKEEQFLQGTSRSVKAAEEHLNHFRSDGRDAVVTFYSDKDKLGSGFSLKYEFLETREHMKSTGPCHFLPPGKRKNPANEVYGSCIPKLKCIQTGRSFVRNRCPRRDHGDNLCCYTPTRN